MLRIFCFIYVCFFFLLTHSYAGIVKKIEIEGNDRVSDETIIMFSSISINDEIGEEYLNKIIKNLYETSLFKDISVKLNNEIVTLLRQIPNDKKRDFRSI